jgi:uncharacterized iron-regulated membrane protein
MRQAGILPGALPARCPGLSRRTPRAPPTTTDMTSSKPIVTRNAALAAAGAPRTRSAEQRVSRGMFYAHLWLGVLFTALLLVISVTGVLLNHKRGLGLMPEVDHVPSGAFNTALPLDDLATRAIAAVGLEGSAAELIDRMDVRPRDGLVKVRLRDASSTEVTVDVVNGSILHIGARGDVFLEKVHSGEALGSTRWVLLSTITAVGLVVLLVSGYWLWLIPKSRR